MYLRTSLRMAAVSLASVFCLFSNPAPGRAQEAYREAAQHLDERTQAVVSDITPAERDALRIFYEERQFSPVWFAADGPTRAATRLLDVIGTAASWGLNARDFVLSHAGAQASLRSPAELAAADYELSAAAVRYARHAAGGRIPDPSSQLSDFIDRRPDIPAPGEALRKLVQSADAGAAILAYHPQHPQFKRLQSELARLTGNSRDGRVRIAERGPLLTPGTTSDEVAKLREQLGVAANGDPRFFDGALKTAVRDFQRARSLRADGMVGDRTRRALNGGGPGNRVDAIVATMEQWRWMPRDLGDTHLFVNIPSFTIDHVRNGETIATERVIVGKPNTPTPAFSDDLSHIVLRPTWALPDSIKREKLIVAARRGRALESEGLVVRKGKKVVKSWKVDWRTADLSLYSIVQPSGGGNALGNVKFLFPNKHSVYVHDTPNRALFSSSDRLYSHGCIRLRNPLDMAQRLLDADFGDDVFDASKLVSKGPDSNEIALQRPIPIHIAYFNVWMSDDGRLIDHGDPYGHAKRVRLALAGRWNEIDKGPSHQTVPDMSDFATAALGRPAIFTDVVITAPRPAKAIGKVRPRGRPAAAKDFVKSAPGYSSGGSGRSGRSVGDLMNSVFAR